MSRAPFEISGTRIAPGTRAQVDVPVAKLYTHAPLHIPVEVVHGRQPGPVLLVCSAIHGDEINGVEIVRRLLKSPSLARLRGTLIAVPIVNVFGFVQHTRYLPDRRDLNRCFPGSDSGSLGSRVAALFREQIADQATHIIDLHTGAIHRTNLPQIRATLQGNDATRQMADAFGAPVLLNAELREGSLRAHASGRGVPVITYEAGEALRFDEWAIRPGVSGVKRVMRAIGMLAGERDRKTSSRAVEMSNGSSWARASIDGIVQSRVGLGDRVEKHQVLGIIADPFGNSESEVLSPADGIIIGMANLPLTNEGEALYHVARFHAIDDAESAVDNFQQLFVPDSI